MRLGRDGGRNARGGAGHMRLNRRLRQLHSNGNYLLQYDRVPKGVLPQADPHARARYSATSRSYGAMT